TAGITAGRAPPPPPPALAASTSRRTTRPPGPLPCRSLRSTPDCAAILRASGEAFTRPPSSDVAAGIGAAGADGLAGVPGAVRVDAGGASGPAAGEGVLAA